MVPTHAEAGKWKARRKPYPAQRHLLEHWSAADMIVTQQWFGATIRSAALLALMAMAVGAAVRVLMVSQAFGTPSAPLEDNGEKVWSFGQLLTMFLLLLPFVSALEIFRGEYNKLICKGHAF